MKLIGLIAIVMGTMWTFLGATGIAIASTWPLPQGAIPVVVASLGSAAFAALGLMALSGGIDAVRGRPSGLRRLADATNVMVGMAVVIGAGSGLAAIRAGAEPLGLFLTGAVVSTVAAIAILRWIGRALRSRVASHGTSPPAPLEGSRAARPWTRRVLPWVAIAALFVGLVLVLRARLLETMQRLRDHTIELSPPEED
jgi:hypothetical protein